MNDAADAAEGLIQELGRHIPSQRQSCRAEGPAFKASPNLAQRQPCAKTTLRKDPRCVNDRGLLRNPLAWQTKTVER
jgi:hypothetical protein